MATGKVTYEYLPPVLDCPACETHIEVKVSEYLSSVVSPSEEEQQERFHKMLMKYYNDSSKRIDKKRFSEIIKQVYNVDKLLYEYGLGLENIRYAWSHKKLLYYVGFSKNLVNESTVNRFNKAFLSLQKQGLIKEIYANSGLRKDEGNIIRVSSETKKTEINTKMKYEVKLLEGKGIKVLNFGTNTNDSMDYELKLKRDKYYFACKYQKDLEKGKKLRSKWEAAKKYQEEHPEETKAKREALEALYGRDRR